MVQQPQIITNNEEVKLLNQKLDQTRQLLRKTFFSSSSTSTTTTTTTVVVLPTKEGEFNFECYVHFRAYNDILIIRGVNFPPFRKLFERMIGIRLLQLASLVRPEIIAPSSRSPSSSSSSPDTTLAGRLNNALRATDAVANLLLARGFVASWERSVPLEYEIEDFSDEASSVPGADLTYSLALNGDVTLDSQLLLQELGYRLYPSFGRWMAREAISRCFAGSGGGGGRVDVQVDDYYMDTGYNSNPDLFEVKQILLNIVVRRD